MPIKTLPKITVERRDKIGSRYALRLRQAGRLPAVIYGHKQEAVHVSLDRKLVTNLLMANTHIVEVQFDGQSQPVLIKDVQWDHLGSLIVHLDLTRIDLTERVTVHVPLVLTGEAEGLKEEGAILEHPLTSMEIECLATEIPDQIKVDVTTLKVGHTVLVKDIKLPAGVTTKLEPEMLVAGISVVKEVVVEVVPVEGAVAEPEVIGRKLEEGEVAPAEGAAGEAPKKGAPGAPAPAAAEKKSEKK
jgi:large subunit ribosomal protein L25